MLLNYLPQRLSCRHDLPKSTPPLLMTQKTLPTYLLHPRMNLLYPLKILLQKPNLKLVLLNCLPKMLRLMLLMRSYLHYLPKYSLLLQKKSLYFPMLTQHWLSLMH